MNEFFASLARRWTELAMKRGAVIAPADMDPKIAEEILQLARVVAHRKERSFAPLASYTAGVASERMRVATDADAPAIAAYIREVRESLEQQASK